MSNHHLKFGKLDKAWKLFLNSGYLSQSKKIFKTYCLSSLVIHNIMAIRILYSFVIFSQHFDPFLLKTLFHFAEF